MNQDEQPPEESGQMESLLPEMYTELKRIAAAYLRRERSDHTLQATALVHEAWLRLAKQDEQQFGNRSAFYGAAASIMRRILIDHARGKNAQKRGSGAVRLCLDEMDVSTEQLGFDLLDLDEALNRLAELNARHARVVELRFFAGMSIEETSQLIGVSDFTVKNDWRVARAWLLSELT